MSDDTVIEDAETAGRETHPPTSPAAAEMAAAGDEHAGALPGVEPDSAPAISLPEALVRYESADAAYAAMLARSPRHDDFASLMADHELRRADNARRTQAWLEGNA